MGAPPLKVRPLKFLQENHLEDISCHTFSTQSADQALIIITGVCQNTQLKHMAGDLIAPPNYVLYPKHSFGPI